MWEIGRSVGSRCGRDHRLSAALRLCGTLLGLMFGVSCSSNITELVLVVDSDLQSPEELRSVTIRVFGSDGVSVLEESVDLSSGEPSLPLTLSLRPAQSKDSSLRIEVDGATAAGSAVLQRVDTAFLPGKRNMVHVVLRQTCVGIVCAEGESCAEGGECVSALVAADTLPKWDGETPNKIAPRCDQVDLTTDVFNCGACGNICTFGICEQGACADATQIATGGVSGGSNIIIFFPIGGVSVLDHSCALVEGGRVSCWGNNEQGQLGDGTRTNRVRPVVVLDPTGSGPLRGATQVAVGNGHSCALLESGQVRCWGENLSGQLGDNSEDQRSLPVAVLDASGVLPLEDVVQIDLGAKHSCAVTSNEQVRCWGANGEGQLGDASTNRSRLPVTVRELAVPLSDIVEVSAGGSHTCARRASEQMSCWGSNSGGQLGIAVMPGEDIATKRFPEPVSVVGVSSGALQNVRSLSAGGAHTCAVVGSQGELRCWGLGGQGRLGTGNSDMQIRPAEVLQDAGGEAFVGVEEVSAGNGHTCAVSNTGNVYCWGSGNLGALGTGNRDEAVFPTEVALGSAASELAGATAISAGRAHTCAVGGAGRPFCWGDNGEAQLGDGTLETRAEPVPVAPGSP